MGRYKMASIDVFTRTRFEGNQLGIVHIPADRPLSQDLKQKVASEIGYSETVFIHDGPRPGAEEDAGRRVDIFTVNDELPFAGHPTIGSIVYLAAYENASSAPSPSDAAFLLSISLKAGPVKATYEPATTVAAAKVPHDVHTHASTVSGEDILGLQPGLAGLCVAERDALAAGSGKLAASFPMVSIVKGMTFALIEMPSLDALGALSPPRDGPPVDMDAGWETVVLGLMFYYLLDSGSEKGVVYARTRMMEHTMGEDAATGSASCALACYLALQRAKASAERVWEFEFVQGVEMGRKSIVGVEITLDAEGQRVVECQLKGSAVVVMRGEIEIE